jgi:hypothetical protein
VTADPRARLDRARAELIASDVASRSLLAAARVILATLEDPDAKRVADEITRVQDLRALAEMDVHELSRELGLDP